MRRTILLTLTFGEILIAGVLLCLGSNLPTPAEVRAGFAHAESVTSHARTQVQVLRRQVDTVRQIELRGLAERMKKQTHTLTQALRTQPLDFSMIGTVRDALGELASGLVGLSEGLDPRAATRLGAGLDETAVFLEEVVVPKAAPVAGRPEREQDAEAVLKDVAATFRQTAKSIDTAVIRWPEIQKTLSRLAQLLHTAREQLHQAVERRQEYEETLQQTMQLADVLAAMLPFLVDQLTGQLDQQDCGLDEMGRSLEEFSTLLPAYGRSATQLIHIGRLLIWLVAIFVLVHTGYLVSRLAERG